MWLWTISYIKCIRLFYKKPYQINELQNVITLKAAEFWSSVKSIDSPLSRSLILDWHDFFYLDPPPYRINWNIANYSNRKSKSRFYMQWIQVWRLKFRPIQVQWLQKRQSTLSQRIRSRPPYTISMKWVNVRTLRRLLVNH